MELKQFLKKVLKENLPEVKANVNAAIVVAKAEINLISQFCIFFCPLFDFDKVLVFSPNHAIRSRKLYNHPIHQMRM